MKIGILKFTQKKRVCQLFQHMTAICCQNVAISLTKIILLNAFVGSHVGTQLPNGLLQTRR